MAYGTNIANLTNFTNITLVAAVAYGTNITLIAAVAYSTNITNFINFTNITYDIVAAVAYGTNVTNFTNFTNITWLRKMSSFQGVLMHYYNGSTVYSKTLKPPSLVTIKDKINEPFKISFTWLFHHHEMM